MDRLTDKMEDVRNRLSSTTSDLGAALLPHKSNTSQAFKLGLRATGAFNNARDAMEGIQAGRTLENQIGFDDMVDLLFNKAEDLSDYGMVRSNDAATGGIDWEATLNSGIGDPLEKAAVLVNTHTGLSTASIQVKLTKSVAGAPHG